MSEQAVQITAVKRLTDAIEAIPGFAGPLMELLGKAQSGLADADLALVTLGKIKAALPIVLSGGITLVSWAGGYVDSRNLLALQGGLDFTVRVKSPLSPNEFLRQLLGASDAQEILSAWKSKNSLIDADAPETCRVVLFTNSNNKTLDVQKEDLEAANFTLADDLQATIICATVVKKALDLNLDLSSESQLWEGKSANILTELQVAGPDALNDREYYLLSTLHEGVIRTRSGALTLYENGKLRVIFGRDFSHLRDYAFGSVPTASEFTPAP